jgi:hypothetical protein
MIEQPEVGDIWVWRGLEHYLLLEREQISYNVFTAIYLQEGELMVNVPIDPKDPTWTKYA